MTTVKKYYRSKLFEQQLKLTKICFIPQKVTYVFKDFALLYKPALGLKYRVRARYI